MKTYHLLAAALFSSIANAHIALEQPTAQAGSSYRATFKVGHGCNGSPTKSLTIHLPDGLRGTKPMPKAGWTLSTTRRLLKTPYESHGKAITEEVATVRWTANTEADVLQDAAYDEFVVRTGLPTEPGDVWFRVQQTCDVGEWFWGEVPTPANPKPPAPAVKLLIQRANMESHAH